VGATDGLDAGFGKSQMLHLALLDEVLDSAGNIFDGHLVIDTVLIEQVDDVGPEALE
jgi:hypothetical protein